MNFIATNESILFFASFLVSLLTIHILWQKHKETNLTWLLLAVIAIAVYNFFAFLDASSADLAGHIFWSKLIYLGAGFIAPLLLVFFLQYPHRRIPNLQNKLFLLFVLPIASLVAVMTNDIHHLFWTGFLPISGSSHTFIFLHGPFYWITVIYNYLCGLAVIAILYIDMHRSSGIYRSQSLLLLISSAFPFIASLIYDLGLNPDPGIDILPIGFSISGLSLVFCIVFLHLFDLIPISRSQLVENLLDGVIVFDQKMRVIDINPAARKLLMAAELKIGCNLDVLDKRFVSVLSEQSQSTEITVDEPQIRQLLFIPNQLIDKKEKIIGSMVIIRDMTEIRSVESALLQSQLRYQSLIEDVLDITSVGICILDKDFKIAWINRAATVEWLTERENLLNQDFRKVLKDYSTSEVENEDELLGKVLLSYRNGTYLEDLEIHLVSTATNYNKWVLYSSRPINVGYYAGGRIEQFVDITEQKALQNKIELLAITDELTGIYNRRGLIEFGRHDFNRARRTKTQLGVIYFDIDNFKELNDHYGHAQGDAIMVETVKRVNDCLRDMDTFARYGGDEFVILVPEADLQQSTEIANRINQVISAAPVTIKGDKLNISLSLGIAQIRAQDTLMSMLNRADLAMYHAKQAGGGHVEISQE